MNKIVVPDEVESIKIEYYESGELPSGSVAVLSDGRRLVTEDAWLKIIAKPNSEVPEAIKDLLLDEEILNANFSRPTRNFFNTAVMEAYRIGQQSK